MLKIFQKLLKNYVPIPDFEGLEKFEKKTFSAHGWRTVGQSNQECKETSECVRHVEKLDLRFLHYKNKLIIG